LHVHYTWKVAFKQPKSTEIGSALLSCTN